MNKEQREIGSVDSNWISPENKKKEREIDQKALEHMKALEIKYSSLRTRVIEKTPFGYHIRYIKQKEE